MEDMIAYQQFTELPPTLLLSSLLDLHRHIFGEEPRDAVTAELIYHRERGPLLLNLAVSNGRVIGFKAGYERKPGHFYSWLGGVDTTFRGQGIAQTLMQQQHDWCRQHGYSTVRTQTYNRWRSMLILNLKHGFDIIGTQQGGHGLIIVLEKRLRADEP